MWGSTNIAPDAPEWLREAQQAFGEVLLDGDADYPCHFGVRGQQDGENWFTAVESDSEGPYSVGGLAETLVAFQQQAWTGPKRQTLIAFVGPPDPAPRLATHAEQFWWLLGRLTAADSRPWPENRTQEVTDPAWQWCFAGEPWFVFGASPAYHARRSRNVGPCLALIFQVLRVFEGLDAMSVAGDRAKHKVRERLRAYDDVGPHPHLGDTLHIPDFKWRQYMLPDDQQLLEPKSCPFQVPAPASSPTGHHLPNSPA
ncbi:YqcI/YcgG family protein [Nocardia sp. NPDC052112]|uniref:YqcI/YcgG family protein n=1 Tax=Nocardia sp. NPDC052112 TaxID=3155646 RepID=UPI00342E4EAD